MLAGGPGLPAGTTVEGFTALDIPATVLEAAGVEVPEEFDSKPMFERSPKVAV